MSREYWSQFDLPTMSADQALRLCELVVRDMPGRPSVEIVASTQERSRFKERSTRHLRRALGDEHLQALTFKARSRYRRLAMILDWNSDAGVAGRVTIEGADKLRTKGLDGWVREYANRLAENRSADSGDASGESEVDLRRQSTPGWTQNLFVEIAGGLAVAVILSSLFTTVIGASVVLCTAILVVLRH
jgi:hypothetical protein